MSVIQIVGDGGLRQALHQRRVRNAIGLALSKAYPTHPWRVAVTEDGSVAQITSPALSSRYGMTLHCDRDTLGVERRAVRMAGELLERFRVSRERADFSGVKRDIAGEARAAKAGGV